MEGREGEQALKVLLDLLEWQDVPARFAFRRRSFRQRPLYAVTTVNGYAFDSTRIAHLYHGAHGGPPLNF